MLRIQSLLPLFALSRVLLFAAEALAEGRTTYQSGWHIHAPDVQPRSTRRLDGDQHIQVSLAISAHDADVAAAVEALRYMSEPGSPGFGKHWTAGQVARRFGRSKDGARNVARWLVDSGIPHSDLRVSSDWGFVSFNTTARQAEELLLTELREHPAETGVKYGFDAYSMPESVALHVDFALPSLPLPARRRGTADSAGSARLVRRQAKAATKVDCFRFMSPHCLRLLYNMPGVDSNATAHPQNSLGVYQSAGSTWLAEDLDAFFTTLEPALVGQRPVMMPINGGYFDRDLKGLIYHLEANLDFEYTMSLAHPLPVTDIQVRRCPALLLSESLSSTLLTF
jgi:tripeptidyl-peptidase I